MNERPLRVAVLSDTHGVLRPDVYEILKGCDRIIHAGDFDTEEIAQILDEIAPAYIVCGNNDGWWRRGRLETLRFELGGVRFFLIHNRMALMEPPEDTDVVVFGHSHVYCEEKTGGCLWLNPGSCGRKRFRLPLTMAVMTIQNGSYSIEKIILEK